MSNHNGILYVVASPIGNLGDLSSRAIEVLSQVELIAAEDTRHSQKLLTHFAIRKQLLSCHQHNEKERVPRLLDLLERGSAIALLSDAGTPLISDPGYRLVGATIAAGIRVVPIPGPCAAIAALSVSGLPTDQFLFVGFLPNRPAARRKRLQALAAEPSTIIIYESPKRIIDTLADAIPIFGAQRRSVLARELTKLHESVIYGTVQEVSERIAGQPDWKKGELVLLLAGRTVPAEAGDAEIIKVLKPLLAELPLPQAVKLAVQITGSRKNQIYEMAVKLSTP